MKLVLNWLEENMIYQFVVLVHKLHLLELEYFSQTIKGQGTQGFDPSSNKHETSISSCGGVYGNKKYFWFFLLITSFVIANLITSFVIAYLIKSFVIAYMFTSFVIAYLIKSCVITYYIYDYIIRGCILDYIICAYLFTSFVISYLIKSLVIAYVIT